MSIQNPSESVPNLPQIFEEESVRAADSIVNGSMAAPATEASLPQVEALSPDEALDLSVVETAVDEAESLIKDESKMKDRVSATVVAIEISWLNEIGRFGALAIAMALSKSNPVISAAAMGGTAAAFEIPAAYAGAYMLDKNERLKATIEKVNNFLGSVKEKFGIARDTKTSVPTKVGLAYFGGSAVSQVIKHREDTTRTYEQNKRYGLGVAASLVGVSSVQGYLIASGVEYPSPDKLGLTALGIGSMIGAAKAFKGWVKRENRRKDEQELINNEETV